MILIFWNKRKTFSHEFKEPVYKKINHFSIETWHQNRCTYLKNPDYKIFIRIAISILAELTFRLFYHLMVLFKLFLTS